MTTLFGCVNIIIYSTLRFTVTTPGAYCFMIIVSNVMLGAFLAMAPTQCWKTFGPSVGGDIYGIYWICISLSNLTAYGIATRVDLNIAFYIFVATSLCSVIMCWFIQFDDINWNQKVEPGDAREIEMQGGIFHPVKN